ncbi:unannotated protein [freshwater metagenome]|uniref:Unannotated protein n=1 Tax=freshwater metagenome TaxID=449393 RepID=A0A6J7IX51_9ZZZZ|nr:ergothioneine biosynthesis protein EgtB [Actinomycetota bacterium]
MATDAAIHDPLLLEALDAARARTLALAGAIDRGDLERQLHPLMSPLVWDLAHIAAYEDLWLVHRHGGEPLLRADLAATYDAFETPRAVRGTVELLDGPGSIEYLAAVRERARSVTASRGADPILHELVLQHELQHVETMLQTITLAGLDGFAPPHRTAVPASDAAHTGLEFVPITVSPAGLEVGAAPEGFAYDNERPRHRVAVAPFELGRTLVTNAAWLAFIGDGGYTRREHWCADGWAWRSDEAIEHPLHWVAPASSGAGWSERTALGLRPLDAHRPAAHVSWFEACAFARAHGARLPTEHEWEAAAQWSGAAPPAAHLGQTAFDTAPVGAHPDGAADCGALDLLGNLWEWTATQFDGYPGFSAFPYPEYSEVFFGRGYRVLRGGSWATDARVATRTFRNWDLPQRRQIFAGVRLARSLEAA